MKTRSGTSGWLLWARFWATIDRAYSLGSENDWILRSRTDASERPSWRILAPSPRPARTRCWLSACGGDDHLLGLLAGPGQLGLGLVLGDLHLDQRVGQLGLHGGLRLGLVEARSFSDAVTCLRVGLDLLDRELPEPQLFEQRLDLAAGLGRVGLADQHVHALDVEVVELAAQLLARLVLDPSRSCKSSSIVFLWATSRKYGAEHRVERLRDQLLDVAEPLDDARGLLVVDVDDDRERQGRLVGVLGDQVDRPQALVIAVRLGPAGHPVEHEVGRRHQDDIARRRC